MNENYVPRVEERPALRVFHQVVDEEADHVDREEHQRVRHQLKGKRRRLEYVAPSRAIHSFHVIMLFSLFCSVLVLRERKRDEYFKSK